MKLNADLLSLTPEYLAMAHSPLHSSSSSPMDTVQRIARYVDTARTQTVSRENREAAFRCLLDVLGAAAAGIRESAVHAVRQSAINTMASGDVPIWFTGSSSSTNGAAWANSAAAAALDIDDGNRLARGHPGAAVFPVALAVAHATEATLEALLCAVVIGYEVGVSIGAARLSYGNTGTWAPYAVVATAAALRGTPVDVIAHALAIAGESAPNQLFASAPPQARMPEGSDVKEGIPWSVATGLAALDLAEAGHSGPRNILDSALHYRFADDFAPGAASHIAQTYFKLYACCRHIHAPLDAALSLIRGHHIDAETIELIEVETYGGALRISNKARPENLVDVQYSIPYCLALAIIVGPEALLPLTTESLGIEAVETLAAKVRLSLDPAIDARFPAQTLARVVITCRGRRFVSALTAPLGEWTDPLSWSALETKLRAVVRHVASPAQAETLLDAVNAARAERLDDLFSVLANVVLTV